MKISETQQKILKVGKREFLEKGLYLSKSLFFR